MHEEQKQLEDELIETLIGALDKAKPILDKQEFTALMYACGMSGIYRPPTPKQASIFEGNGNAS